MCFLGRLGGQTGGQRLLTSLSGCHFAPPSEDFIHDLRALCDDRPELLPVHSLRRRLAGVPDNLSDAIQRDAVVGEQRDKAVTQLTWRPLRLQPRLPDDGFEVTPDVGRVERLARPGGEDAAGWAPLHPSRRPLLLLPPLVLFEDFNHLPR